MKEALWIIRTHHGLGAFVRVPTAQFWNGANNVNRFSVICACVNMEDHLIGIPGQNSIFESIADIRIFCYGNGVFAHCGTAGNKHLNQCVR